ncbi:acyl-CoA dehydrogenase family protein [Nocardia fluminea]|uniref:Alkylation response protein AidB-like acyl-CoA dehydrogenase n=1 Tax=Nocardia fluminea TaxID=134984 RepID=A0A2N3VBI5_9NOCA|nr:acyl-CoA dehydrogenase family protein [Nocardia fluminea]PKV78926.1 alkylation response protein AidB-like acyl-CoA dehydrogenase [Nocardia fluminea]
MTVVTAERITTADQAVRIATELAEVFAAGAVERDHSRRLPHEELDQLSASGLLAITVPAEFGGADLPPSVVAEVVRILAAADPNIAQVPHSHFVYLNLLRLAGSRAQRHDYFGKVLAGARIANAQSERGGATVADISTVLRPDHDRTVAGVESSQDDVTGGAASARIEARRFVVEGTKYYCTGSLFADVLAVLTRLDDPQGVSGLAPGEYVVFVPALEPGVRIVDDWDALGQRTTGSGTVEFAAVKVGPEQLVSRASAVNAPTGYGAFAQLLHAAIDAGIARGALAAAAEFVRTRSRPWFEAEVAHAVDDPLVVQRFGELGVAVAAAESTLIVAGAAVDAAVRPTAVADRAVARDGHSDAPGDGAQASIAVATAKILADRAANEVSAAIFEVGGTRSAAAEHRLDHFWRNARTHTLHDPVRWKYQHIGRAVLHNRPPPLHGVI